MTPATRAVAAFALSLVAACGDPATGPDAQPERDAGTWKTWVIANGATLRPLPPPAAGSAEATAELEEIVDLQRTMTPEQNAAVVAWNDLPTSRWHEQALDLSAFYWALLPDIRIATPARSARAFALLHVAMYDALVATWDAKYAYRRVAPARASGNVRALVPVGDLPSYPSEHAAAAAAAAAVLSYLFPTADTLRLHGLEREAGESRILAGAAFRSDVEAGFTIGRAVAAQVIERAKNDGTALPWSGAVPAGAGLWQPTPPRYVQVPFDAPAGSWRTWVIAADQSLRPPPPPAVGSPAFETDLEELRRLSTTRTAEQADVARFWASESPSSRWEVFMRDEIAQRKLGTMHAARAMALASVATYDAMVACWEAKFYYWMERPITADPTLRTAFSTPPFPSYPSGHSTLSSAVGEVFAELFPDAATKYRAKAEEASLSRMYAAVHYRFDVLAGEELGRRVGMAVVARARVDGAHP